jgi:hypothetical protein
LSEPARPITQIAEPIDRSGPRRINFDGRRALRGANLGMAWCTAAWLLNVPERPLQIVLATIAIVVGPSLALAATVAAIRALMVGYDRHLLRIEALTGLVVGLLALGVSAVVIAFPTSDWQGFAVPAACLTWWLLQPMARKNRHW